MEQLANSIDITNRLAETYQYQVVPIELSKTEVSKLF